MSSSQCPNCTILQQEIDRLKSENLQLKSSSRRGENLESFEQPPSYSPSGDMFNLQDPPNASITLVHGYNEVFGEKFAMQFKLYNFTQSQTSDSFFTGQGNDVDRGHYQIRGSWQDSDNCTITLLYKEITTEYTCFVDWEASSISGTFCLPGTITGGDPFEFTFFKSFSSR